MSEIAECQENRQGAANLTESNKIETSDDSGLEWRKNWVKQLPYWTREPNTAKVCARVREALHLPEDADCQITRTWFNEGSPNKVYKVEAGDSTVVVRVTLPVLPGRKIESEALSMKWADSYTSMPVPKVIAYDMHRDNVIGFENITIDFVSGTTLDDAWSSLSISAKINIAKQLALYQHELYSNGPSQHAIGGLEQDESGGYRVASIVSEEFYRRRPHHCGPFLSSRDWLETRLTLHIAAANRILAETPSDNDREDAEITLSLAQSLLEKLELLLPEACTEGTVEETHMHHPDLHGENIMVGPDGKVVGILDRESTRFAPRWKACQLSKVLSWPVICKQPAKKAYADDKAYQRDLRAWETGIMRKAFLAEMKALNAEWYRTFEQEGRFLHMATEGEKSDAHPTECWQGWTARFDAAVESVDTTYEDIAQELLNEFEKWYDSNIRAGRSTSKMASNSGH